MVFSGMFQSRDVKEERFAQAKTFGDCRASRSRRLRIESLVIQTIMNHLDSGPRKFKKLHQVVGGILTHSNDSILAMRQPANDNASVEHAFPIILARNTERSQVMDRGDKRAWFFGEQTAVAGKRQHIQ